MIDVQYLREQTNWRSHIRTRISAEAIESMGFDGPVVNITSRRAQRVVTCFYRKSFIVFLSFRICALFI